MDDRRSNTEKVLVATGAITGLLAGAAEQINMAMQLALKLEAAGIRSEVRSEALLPLQEAMQKFAGKLP